MKQFDIYWIDLDPTCGAEIKKLRPCVIISPDELNYLQTRLIAPITSKGFEAPFRIDFKLENKDAKILCDQIRCVSVERFRNKMSSLQDKEKKQLKRILKEMFA